MRILRAADRKAQPWKNGGGITREVAAWPEGSGFDDFHWRVSLAEVNGDGPFSVFPEVDRILAVLQGRLVLRIAGRGDTIVTPETPPAEFPGDAATFGGVAEGPVHDLNLMARRGVVKPKLERLRVDGAHALAPSPATRLVIPTGPIRCEPSAPSTTSWSPSPIGMGEEHGPVDRSSSSPAGGGGGPRSGGGGAGSSIDLAALDALWLDAGTPALTLRAAGVTVYVATFA